MKKEDYRLGSALRGSCVWCDKKFGEYEQCYAHSCNVAIKLHKKCLDAAIKYNSNKAKK